MSRILVNGSNVQIATGYGTAFTISDITNASPAVATLSSSHGVVEGDFIEITSCAWGRLVGRVFRAGTVATNDVQLENLDTTDTDIFPAGTITGGGKEVTGWTTVSQITEMNVTGGEQQFAEGQYMDDPLQYRYPTIKTAVQIAITVDDDQSQSYWSYINASESSLANKAIRFVDANSVPRVVATGIWMKSAAPAMSINGVYKRSVSIALASGVTEYAD